MIAEIISFGTELLLGQIVDTDAAYLAQKLSQLGVSVYNRATVGDNLERACGALRLALSRSDVVFCIGGLGPTGDDLTRTVISTVLDAPLVRDPALVAHLTQWFERRGYPVSEAIFLQADVPTGGQPIPNANGTAPGLWVEQGGKTVVALPGPPNEFVPMVDSEILPRIGGGSGGATIRSRTLRIVGMGESTAEEKTKDLMAGANPSVAPYAKPAEVHLRVTAKAATAAEADGLIAPVVEEIKNRLGSVVYGEDDQTLEEVVVRLLEAQKKTVATAESCTGGWLAQRITAISGSSSVFETGFVTYANATKTQLLGISEELLARVGAVSPEVAQVMAEQAKVRAQADFGIGITGIAGPGGGSDEKPVGLVYIALAGPDGVEVTKNLFTGQRPDVRWRATQRALDLLRQQLLG